MVHSNLEGKPVLGSVLWRVRVDGSSPVPARTSLQLSYSLPETGSDAITGYARFAVHPDGKRIVIETFRFQESDITMIENIR